MGRSSGIPFPSAIDGDGAAAILEAIGDPLDLTLLAVGTGAPLERAHELLSEYLYRELELEQLSGADGDALLLCTGAFAGLGARVLGVAELRFDHVIVLPASIELDDDTVREMLARTRATVFAPDPESHRRIVSLCDARLAPGLVPPARPPRAPSPSYRGQRNGRPASTHRVTAIVLSHGQPEQALRAIDSLHAGELALQTVVLDNNSPPDAAAALAAGCAEREAVSLHRSDRNLGCAGGRRAALEHTDSELVMFLDDDAELEPGALALLVADLDDHPAAGASTATVLLADATVHHSGGWIEVCDGVADFSRIAAGGGFAEVPASGPCGWAPGTAVLVRRELLARHPIDAQMRGYYEDNEWCYRVAQQRPQSFRRVREARAVHHFAGRHSPGVDFATRAAVTELLGAHARFYQRHGLVLGSELFELVPELRDHMGVRDVASARVLMELMLARGHDWVLMQWCSGELDGLLGGARARAAQRAELEQLRRQLAEQDQLVSYLFGRHHALDRIEHGGWWQLRERALPLLRAYWRARGREGA